MYRDSIITLVIIILIYALASPMNISVCFKDDSWCPSELSLCANASTAYIMNVSIDANTNNKVHGRCNVTCTTPSQSSLGNATLEVLKITCNGKRICSFANVAVPTTDDHKGGTLTLTFLCNYTDNGNEEDNITTNYTGTTTETTESSVTSTAIHTTRKNTILANDSLSSTGNSTLQAGTVQPLPDSGDPNTAVILVSVVVPIIIVVVVVAVLMYRRGQCKLLLSKCIRRCDQHSPDRADAYAMSSTANANLTYDLSRSVDENGYDIDYCKINKIGKEINVDYSHVISKKMQARQDSEDTTYNHIGHFNSTSEDIEPTYNHVGDEMLKNTNFFTLQPDTYSHIGAMANPASGHLTDNSYSHINGVMKYIPTSYDVNQYDSTVFESNDGPTGGFRNQERDMKSDREREFNVVGPSKVDCNNEAPVSHSYFILEKHAKEA